MSTLNICTWVYCDEAGDVSSYPQNPGVSSSGRFQAVYWRCCVSFFATSLRVNPFARHLLFTNRPAPPLVDGLDVGAWLRHHGVAIVPIALSHRTPEGYFGQWRNQFYLFDILKYVANVASPTDEFFLLDSDCVWVRSAQEVIALLRSEGALVYGLPYTSDESVNGLTRRQMGVLFNEIRPGSSPEVPLYFGGEWLAATGDVIRRLSAASDLAWKISLRRHAEGRTKFNEEAHMLSFLYHEMGFHRDSASPFVKRMWTNVLGYNNVAPADVSLVVWHLPYEKRYGLKRLFNQALDEGSPLWRAPVGSEWQVYLSRMMGVPRRSAWKFIVDIALLMRYRVLERRRG